MTATFQTISSTREEYLQIIEDLKAKAPKEIKKGQKRTKLEACHIALIKDLEGRIEAIDSELAVSNCTLTCRPVPKHGFRVQVKRGMILLVELICHIVLVLKL